MLLWFEEIFGSSMSNLFFSIIIPTYNSEETIEKCIQSIINQSFEKFEILVMDGKSKDTTVQIVESYEDNRIHIFSEEDKGVYFAMNKGLEKAKGEWIYFLGSDDELYSNEILQNTYLSIAKTKVVYGNVLVKGNAGWAKDGDIYDGPFSRQKIITNNICHQAIFYNKVVFEKIGSYNTDYFICADHDFNIRACALFQYEYIDIIVAKFNGGGISSRTDFVFREDFDDIVIKNHLTIVHQLNISNRRIFKKAIDNLKKGHLFLSLHMFAIIVYKKLFINFLKK